MRRQDGSAERGDRLMVEHSRNQLHYLGRLGDCDRGPRGRGLLTEEDDRLWLLHGVGTS